MNIDSVSVVEKLEQSRTHSVLSKKEEPLKDKDDVQEEIKDQGADVPEEVKGSEGKSDTASVQQQQEVVAEEIEGEQEVETAVPAQSLDEQEKPTEGTKQHTESPVSQPEEEIEEVEEVKAEVKVCSCSSIHSMTL